VETITKNMNDMLGQAKDLPPYIYGNLVFMQKSVNFSINQLMSAKQATDLYINALHAAYKKEQAAKNAKPSGASGGSGQARLANA
jgi:hypothetical protein